MATAATRDYQIDREAVTIGLHRVSQKLVLCIHHCEELVNRAPRAVLRANLVHKHRSHSEIKDTAGMRPFGVVPAGGRMPIARRSLVLERDTLRICCYRATDRSRTVLKIQNSIGRVDEPGERNGLR